MKPQAYIYTPEGMRPHKDGQWLSRPEVENTSESLNNKKIPKIKVVNDHLLSCVNEHEYQIAILVDFHTGKHCSNAKNALAIHGYTTDFAEWDKYGALVRFIKGLK